MFKFLSSKNKVTARAIFLVPICIALLLLVPKGSSKQSVRSELVQLQNQNGLRLVAVRDNKLFTVNYGSRTLNQSKPLIAKGTAQTGTVSLDGTMVAISLCFDPDIADTTPYGSQCRAGRMFATVHPDGSDLKVYRDFANPALSFCWSHDMSKIALTMQDLRQGPNPPLSLQIVDLASERTEIIGNGLEAFVNSQCWSRDDKRLVYTVNRRYAVQTVRMYDTEMKKSTDIASGGHATWSPDGQWIAFLDCPPSLRECKYYGMQISTGEKKLLVKKDGLTGLLWSPDSRFVAYVDSASALERTPLEQLREVFRLRVRRLDDGAEDSFADFYDGDFMWFDWVSSP